MRTEFNALPLGDTIHSSSHKWKAIYTPGHADDHVSFLDEETGRLFSGDLFVAPKTKVIMDSIRKLLTYEFRAMFCCHAGYIENGKEMMKQKLDYLENLSGEVGNLYKEGRTIDEINQILLPKKYPIIAFSEGQWDSRHIVSSIVSHIK